MPVPPRWKLVACLLVVLACAGTARAGSLDLPARHWGLSFGNSSDFTGLRFNLRDGDTGTLTGINTTLWIPRDKPRGRMRGLSLGLVGAGEQRVQGVAIGGLGAGAGAHSAGVIVGGLGAGAGESAAGLIIGGLGAGAGENAAGIIVGGLGAGAGEDATGIIIGGLGAGAGNNASGLLIGGLGAGAGERFTGVGLGGIGVGSSDWRGLAVTGGYLKCDRFAGLGVAGYARAKERCDGLAIALFNWTRELHGVQIGLLNYAGNNRRGTKWLPGLNAHFN